MKTAFIDSFTKHSALFETESRTLLNAAERARIEKELGRRLRTVIFRPSDIVARQVEPEISLAERCEVQFIVDCRAASEKLLLMA